MKYLITGGCGFIGSNLAEEVLRRKEKLVVFDNLHRNGSIENLTWLQKIGDFDFIHGDIRNKNDVQNVFKSYKPDVIFHLCGQVAMTTSIENPTLDFEINALGTLNLLEAVRDYSNESLILYSSTNKVYGDLEQYKYTETETRYICDDFPEGFPEEVGLDFHSPYGCSKGTAEQYILDYHRIFGIKTAVFRHSSMYGGRQFATFDQGWVGWFCRKALELQSGKDNNMLEISGTGKQVRDLLYASDVVELYFTSVDYIENIKGQAFNIGGGVANSLSLIELFAQLESMLDIKLDYHKNKKRISDQRVFIADNSKITRLTGWSPKIDSTNGIKKMIEWIRQ